MKRYLLFVNQEYYSSPGMYGCRMRTNDFQQLMKKVKYYTEQDDDWAYIQYYDAELDDYFDWDFENKIWKEKCEYNFYT